MERFIGTKEVMAAPVSQAGTPGYAVRYADGYTSWSPKEAFDGAYRGCEPGTPQTLTFGDAIHFLKQHRRVSRTGWNGKGMWLMLVDLKEITDDSGHLDNLALLPWIGMKTAQGDFVPWLASQTDVLAEDWQVID